MNKWFRQWVLILMMALSATAARGDFYVAPGGAGTCINYLPYTIDTPGYYYLDRNLATTGNGITVTVDRVVIDLRGFSLTGGRTAEKNGINASLHTDVEVRNGTVRDFDIGIAGFGSNIRIMDVRVTRNLSIGIFVIGDARIQDSTVSYNQHGIVISYGIIMGKIVNNNTAYGIYTAGYSVLIGNMTNHNGNTGIEPGTESLVDKNAASGNPTNYAAGTDCTWGLNLGR
jgi:hypothetical protein